jgi:acyl-CoA synthetase (AMP-forming)/AMP-acid ligase II
VLVGAPDGGGDCISFDLDALRAHAEAHLAPYKRPKEYVVTRSLPRTATGKLQRRLVPGMLGFGSEG